MKKASFFLALLVSITFSSCSRSGDDFFIPNIANLWQSTRPSTFSFNDYNTGVNELTFTGNEDYDSGDFGTFTGKFKNYDVEFTFNSGPENTIRFSGHFVKGSDPLQMVVTGTNGVTLTITKQ